MGDKKINQEKYIIKRFYELAFLADIAQEVGVSKQRVKHILDRSVSRREQNYVKAIRSAYLEYKRKTKEINKRYGKISN